MDIKRRGGGRSPVHARKIERPSRLLQPGPDVALELGMIPLGDAPTGDIGVEIVFHGLCGHYLLEHNLAIRMAVSGRLADQRGMEAGLVEPKSRQFPPEARIVLSRH